MASKRESLGQIVIRPPEGMRDRIKAAAEENNRSMNAEIVATLEEKYPAPAPPNNDFDRLKLITTFVDEVYDNDKLSIEQKKVHLNVLQGMMRDIAERLSEDEVAEALSGWQMPPRFSLFDNI